MFSTQKNNRKAGEKMFPKAPNCFMEKKYYIGYQKRFHNLPKMCDLVVWRDFLRTGIVWGYISSVRLSWLNC